MLKIVRNAGEKPSFLSFCPWRPHCSRCGHARRTHSLRDRLGIAPSLHICDSSTAALPRSRCAHGNLLFGASSFQNDVQNRSTRTPPIPLVCDEPRALTLCARAASFFRCQLSFGINSCFYRIASIDSNANRLRRTGLMSTTNLSDFGKLPRGSRCVFF